MRRTSRRAGGLPGDSPPARSAARLERPLWLPMIALGGLLAAVTAGVLHTSAVRPGVTQLGPPLSAAQPGGEPQWDVRGAGRSVPAAGPLDPTRFAPGSCMALPPTSGDRGQTVFVDAGHGGPDTGGIAHTNAGPDVSEKALTLPVALATADNLRGNGFRVVLSRTTDSTVTPISDADLVDGTLSTLADHRELLARVQCANLSKAAALVSIHFDCFDDPTVQGMTTLYDQDRPFSARNQALATDLQQSVLASLGKAGWSTTDRGIADDTTSGGGELTAQGTAYGHLDLLGPPQAGYLEEGSDMPGALVEPLFITNPSDESAAASPAGQHAIAAGISAALQQFL